MTQILGGTLNAVPTNYSLLLRGRFRIEYLGLAHLKASESQIGQGC